MKLKDIGGKIFCVILFVKSRSLTEVEMETCNYSQKPCLTNTFAPNHLNCLEN